MTKKNNHGFSLIELLITVAIVGILGSIALPAYMSSVVKGRRAQARTALAELLQQQERYMTQRNCYLAFSTNTSSGATTPSAPSPATACGGTTASSAPFKGFSSDTLANSSYILSAATCPDGTGGTLSIADCVRVVATPIKTDIEAGAIWMTSTGTKSCDGSKPTVCWK